MSIKVQGLSKTYAKQTAVNNISFTANSGRIVGFLGPNGAGKSTTMKMLTGYLQPSAGSVELCGLDVQAQPVAIKKLMGYLPEHTPLYTDMYVQEFLSFVASTYGLQNADEKVKQTIQKVGLQAEQHKKIAMLSKGYKQRVGLAQAIIHDPQVLILDEPTSGLDPNQLTDIRTLIKTLGKDKTVILSTHIMQEVEALCDDVIILHQGKIVANQSLDSLKNEQGDFSLEQIFRKLTASTTN
ncbi:ATP-binding cassette domain-containing protein [Pedobacter duraquae]|uniref:ABC-2 type transport system ATP-binding protein n=1 Tax=Pedobacter duraquae TaxID=425511 RepID=A0A4R6ILU5_9SPHI|nr:ATP-binding cassette domain-containing protein [Pedobacter duraquae]TDO23041.1 ABC-2 type transport system ATP-binding protein [Pedobacter duraquae]